MDTKLHIANLVVGCGLSGATLARQIATVLGEEVLVIDAKDHLAGSCHDYWDEHGICIHRYGAHIFHTNNAKVWRYLSDFTPWVPYMHEVTACIDGQEVPVPFNLNSIHQCFPEALARRLEEKLLATYGLNVKVPILQLRQTGDEDLSMLADYVYEKVFLHYTLKQWGMKPEEVDASVTARVPVYVSRDNRYFQDKYQGIPQNGYTEMVRRMLEHPLIQVKLGTTYAQAQKQFSFKRLFYTGQIDEFFGYCHGHLPYRSLRFELQEHERRWFQSRAVINYPCNYDYTRICEPKHFLDKGAASTVISLEYPQEHQAGKNEPYYPIQNEANATLYARYRAMADELGETYFLGRLGDYRYYNMDEAVARALELAESLSHAQDGSEQKILVSVIVPIYKVEKYLRQCVDSILAQTLKCIEVILVNDGSPDACPQICDEYAARDPRVRVIHKANSGYGASMNQGLKLARGEYISIIESDDWADPNMLMELCSLAIKHKVQVVRSNYYDYTDEGGSKLVELLPAWECNEVINPRKKNGVFYCPPAIWSSIYKRSFLEEAHIAFLESPGASYQDTGFNFKVWAMASTAWLTPKAYYHYRCDHQGSSVKSQDKIFCVSDEWHEIERFLKQYPEKERESYVLRNHLKLGSYRWNLDRLTDEARMAFRKVFSEEYKEILKHDGLCKECISSNEWKRLMKIIYINPWEYRFFHLWHKLVRMVVKSKIRNGKRVYSVLGMIRFQRDIQFPEWRESEAEQPEEPATPSGFAPAINLNISES